MKEDLELSGWISIVEREYLRDFIPAGGAAVKFVVVRPPLSTEEVRQTIEDQAREADFHFAYLDSSKTKLHMIDHLFKAVAKQVDWNASTRVFLERLLQSNGLNLPTEAKALRVHEVAQLNNYEDPELRRQIRGWLNDGVYKDFAMAQEFRIAMMRLCQAELEGGENEALDAANIKDWLSGDLRIMSALKSALIYQKIARYNARDMFLSLAHWLRLTGSRGLVLVLDISRYTAGKRPAESDGTMYHGTAAAMDVYEVLRQFIDSTDEMESCFLVVLAPPEFLSDDKRGLARYQALNLRVRDEVRDRRRPNPLSSLVRVSTEAVAKDQANA